MDTIKVIKERKSIRKYLDKDIKLNVISEILEAGIYAPSAGNMQNWRFLIIRDKNKIEQIADACLNQTWINQSPVVIVVCNDNKDIKGLYKKKGERYSVQNCAIAIQNILLAAYDKGLGSCLVGAFNGDRVRRVLDIPDDIPIEGVITLGYAGVKPGPRDGRQMRRKAIEHVVFFEKYGNRELDFSLWPLEKYLEKLKGKLDWGRVRKLFKK